MGALGHNSTVIAAAMLALSVAGSAVADELPEPSAEAPVSTPPSAPSIGPTAATDGDPTRAHVVPLTRAATRERIDAMSPVDWLSGYGAVVVGGTD